jgi:hypothetical protein
MDDIKQLTEDVETLKERRILQSDFTPDCVKTRAMGEANRFVFSGPEAARPIGHQFGNSTTIFFATDTLKLYIWTGSVWKSATLS